MQVTQQQWNQAELSQAKNLFYSKFISHFILYFLGLAVGSAMLRFQSFAYLETMRAWKKLEFPQFFYPKKFQLDFFRVFFTRFVRALFDSISKSQYLVRAGKKANRGWNMGREKWARKSEGKRKRRKWKLKKRLSCALFTVQIQKIKRPNNK